MEVLQWDSDFFGMKIARVECANFNQEKYRQVQEEAAAQGVQLVYCFASEENGDEPTGSNVRLVDNKVIYSKQTDSQAKNKAISNYIEEYNVEPNQKLLELAVQSGEHSRFFVDPHLPEEKFIQMYETWIRKSVNGTMAYKVLVTKEDEHITGMVTLAEKHGRGDIGLLAVDKNYRGRGIANTLMQASEQDFAQRFNESQVVTQGDNTAACRLYEKYGYQQEKSEYIYHIHL